MDKIVRVENVTGNPLDTKVIVDGKALPLSHLMDVDIRIRPDEIVSVSVELKVDDLNILGKVDV